MILVVNLSLNRIEVWAIEQEGSSSARNFNFNTQDILAPGKLGSYLKDLKKKKINAVSFRVLFGGDYFKEPCPVNEKFYYRLRKLLPFYPFYIPLAEKVIKLFRAAIAKVPFFVFFETSFFTALPQEAKYYPLSHTYSDDSNIRRWGFQGIFHEFNSRKACRGKRVVSIVLDKQTTVCPVHEKRPLAISLGYTPLEGVMGRTSCGDLDPGIVFYLMKKHKFSIRKIDDILKNESGFLGISGYDLDLPQLYKLYGKDSKVTLSFDIYKTEILKYMGEAVSLLGGLDCLVIAGSYLNQLLPVIYTLLKNIYFLGVSLKDLPWPQGRGVFQVSAPGSRVKVYLNSTPLEEIIFCNTKKYLG